MSRGRSFASGGAPPRWARSLLAATTVMLAHTPIRAQATPLASHSPVAAPDVLPFALPQVRYAILRAAPNGGARPTRTSAVEIRYEGRVAGGAVFDTSRGKGGPNDTAILPLRSLIGGVQAALMEMRPGDRWLVYVPPQLAYGTAGAPLAGKALIFDLELVDWAETPAPPPPLLSGLPTP